MYSSHISSIFLLVLYSVNGEIFSSSAGLHRLLDTERRSIDLLNQYIESEENRLRKLNSLVESNSPQTNFFPAELTDKYGGSISARSNPIDAFLSLKRIVMDKTSIFGLMRMNEYPKFLSRLKGVLRPKEEDLNGAATALLRLQDTYLLDADAIAQGNIDEIPKCDGLKTDDIFRIAFVAFQHKDFYHAVIWLNATMASMQREANNPSRRSFTIPTLFDYLAYSLYSQGNVEHALWYTRVLQSLNANHPAVENIAYYENIVSEQPIKSRWDGNFTTLPPLKNKRLFGTGYKNYEKLCRGANSVPESLKKTLNCYLKNDNDFLKFAPIKVERLYSDPAVYLFHDVITENEIQKIQDIARPQLQRALVVNDKPDQWGSSENVAASYRIAQNMWLEDVDNPVVNTISRRIEHMTGLSMQSAEGLQVANYGMGGHYEPHYDMDTDFHTSINDTVKRNRIATILLYLSETFAGGSTVFEDLGIGVPPLKGAALFWHNLHRNSDPDMRTKHAGCPVLYGQKWVANKWPHEAGQEFRRKCSLNPHE